MTYQDLGKEYPKLKIRFDSYILPVILVETEDIDLIEDMFYRLNEAVPLNAAEKRNAYGGKMAKIIRELAVHTFFTEKVMFGNGRFQHLEVSARLLFIELSLMNNGKITDTKKPYLDKMVLDYRENSSPAELIEEATKSILNEMSSVFVANDALLRAQSAITMYYLVFRAAMSTNQLDKISRGKFFEFYENLSQNRKIAEEDITKANYEYLEYDRLSQQGTNDASSIRERVRIISEYLGIQAKQEILDTKA